MIHPEVPLAVFSGCKTTTLFTFSGRDWLLQRFSWNYRNLLLWPSENAIVFDILLSLDKNVRSNSFSRLNDWDYILWRRYWTVLSLEIIMKWQSGQYNIWKVVFGLLGIFAELVCRVWVEDITKSKSLLFHTMWRPVKYGVPEECGRK